MYVGDVSRDISFINFLLNYMQIPELIHCSYIRLLMQ